MTAGEPTPAGQVEQAKQADAPTDARVTHGGADEP